MQSVFRFKQFELKHGGSGMKLTTDSLLLGAWVEPGPDVHTIVDAGSGCGILALMCAQRFPDADITAVDNNRKAYDEALENFKASPWSNRLHPVLDDINKWADTIRQPVDLILCNPPYFTETLRSPDPARADARHAATLSAESIIKTASRILSKSGTLAIVIPDSHYRRLSLPASIAGLSVSRIARVAARQGKDPSLTLLQFSRSSTLQVAGSQTIDIRDYNGNFTDIYRQLTHPFLLYDKKA